MPPTLAPTDTLRLPVIDGLRGCAILGVIWHHLAGESWQAPLHPLLGNGWMGVNLFFFLSGLVLYLPYVAGRRRMATADDVAAFRRHRARRLLPLFYISLLVGFVLLAPLQEPASWVNLGVSLSLLFPFYPPAFAPPGNYMLWSLGTEIYFCLAMPLLIRAIARIGITRVAAACLVVALMVRIAGFLLFPSRGDFVNVMGDSILGRIDDFALGMLAAVWLQQGRRLALRWLPVGLAALVAAPVLSDLWAAGSVPIWAQAFTYTLVNCGLLVTTNALLLRGGPLASLLSIQALRVIGMMCFSLYVWHGILARLFQRHLPMHDWLTGGPLWPILLYAGVLAFVATASYVVIEWPGRPWRVLFGAERASGSREVFTIH